MSDNSLFWLLFGAAFGSYILILFLAGCSHTPLPEHLRFHSIDYPCPGEMVNYCEEGKDFCVCASFQL